MDGFIRKNIKVVVNARFLCQPLTGVQRFAIEISLRLKEIMHDSIVFVAPKDIRQQEIANKLNVIVIGTQTGQIWEQWDLLRFLQKMKRPLLLCLGGGAPVFYKNLVFTLHDIVYVRFPESYSFAYRLFYGKLIPNVLKNAKKIITVSEFSKKEITDYYHISKEKIEVINNAVGDIFFRSEASISEDLVKQKYFLAVSSPAYHKNFSFLVNSFLNANLSKEIKLFIVGQLDSKLYQNNSLDEKIKNNERVHFLGRISDEALINYYHNAEAFVFPSLYEGFGIPPLEAQACGTFVLSSNAASLPEILGDSVLYFSPTDSSSLEKLLEEFIKSKEKNLEEYKRKMANNTAKYSWDNSANKVLQLINSINE